MAIMQDAMAQQQGAPPPAPGQAPPGPAPPGAMPPEAGAPPAAEEGGYTNDLPDEEQDRQLASFLDNAYTIIYGGQSEEGKVNPDVAESLRAGAGQGGAQEGAAPQEGGAHGAIEALAGTAAQIGARVAGSAGENNIQLDGPGVVLPATFSLVEDLADIAVREGIYDYAEDELAAAVTRTGEILFNQTQDLGLWKQEEFDAAVQEALALNESGELDKMAPQTSAAMGAAAGGGGQGGGAPPPPPGPAAAPPPAV